MKFESSRWTFGCIVQNLDIGIAYCNKVMPGGQWRDHENLQRIFAGLFQSAAKKLRYNMIMFLGTKTKKSLVWSDGVMFIYCLPAERDGNKTQVLLVLYMEVIWLSGKLDGTLGRMSLRWCNFDVIGYTFTNYVSIEHVVIVEGRYRVELLESLVGSAHLAK